MATKTASFTKEKETKNTIRFQEDSVAGQPPIMNTVYIQKWVVGNATKIKVTVEVL